MILSFVFIGTLSAQGLGFGIKGGVNMSKLVGDDVEELSEDIGDVKFLPGFAAGGFATMPIFYPLEIRVEALYSQNGVKYYGSEGFVEGSLSMKMNWLNVPVLVGINVIPNIRVFAGPYFDLFLSGKTKMFLSYESEVIIDEEEDIDSDDIKSLVVGFVAGAALGITDNIELELRMSRGLGTIDKEPKDWDDSFEAYEESDIKPNVYQLLINFYLKK